MGVLQGGAGATLPIWCTAPRSVSALPTVVIVFKLCSSACLYTASPPGLRTPNMLYAMWQALRKHSRRAQD